MSPLALLALKDPVDVLERQVAGRGVRLDVSEAALRLDVGRTRIDSQIGSVGTADPDADLGAASEAREPAVRPLRRFRDDFVHTAALTRLDRHRRDRLAGHVVVAQSLDLDGRLSDVVRCDGDFAAADRDPDGDLAGCFEDGHRCLLDPPRRAPRGAPDGADAVGAAVRPTLDGIGEVDVSEE